MNGAFWAGALFGGMLGALLGGALVALVILLCDILHKSQGDVG
jgi:hypothetical protein